MIARNLETDNVKVFGIAIAVTAVGAAILYYLIRGQLELIAYLIMLVAAAAALVLETRWSVAVVIFFTAISGFVKLLADYSPLAHLDNDVVYVMFLAGYVARRTSRADGLPKEFPFRRTVFLLIAASFMLTAAPMTTVVQALGGWKSYVLPALVVIPVATDLRAEGSIKPLVWALILAGVLNAGVTLVEISQGRDAVAAWGPGFTRIQAANAFDAAGASIWRPPGISSDGGGGAPIDAEAIVLCVMIATSRVNLFVRGVMVAVIGLCLLSLFQEGIRTSIVEAGIGCLVALSLNRGNRRLPSIGVALVVGWLAFNALGSVFATSTVHQSRITSLIDPQTYLGSRGDLVFKYIPQTFISHPLGVGMGQTIPAAAFLSQLAGSSRYEAASENMMLGMMLELGWAGALVVILLVVQVARTGYRYFRARSRSVDGDIALVVLMALLATGFSGDLLVIQFSALQIWAFAAILASREARLRLEPDPVLPARPPLAALHRVGGT